jgi:hypothetical protein
VVVVVLEVGSSARDATVVVVARDVERAGRPDEDEDGADVVVVVVVLVSSAEAPDFGSPGRPATILSCCDGPPVAIAPATRAATATTAAARTVRAVTAS